MKIRSNAMSMNTLRHSDNNLNHVKSSISKLSSGTRINSAADGPADLIAVSYTHLTLPTTPYV